MRFEVVFFHSVVACFPVGLHFRCLSSGWAISPAEDGTSRRNTSAPFPHLGYFPRTATYNRGKPIMISACIAFNQWGSDLPAQGFVGSLSNSYRSYETAAKNAMPPMMRIAAPRQLRPKQATTMRPKNATRR